MAEDKQEDEEKGQNVVKQTQKSIWRLKQYEKDFGITIDYRLRRFWEAIHDDVVT